MKSTARCLSLDEWDERYRQLVQAGLREADYGGPLRRHVVTEGDLRLRHLRFDNSAASLRLWNFLLSENQRLRQARQQGDKLVGTMKDLGTVPVIAYSLPGMRAFYPDGAWWTPCLMECSDGLLQQAEALGIDASFCPVRAMLAAFVNQEHFPRPDLLVCSSGAVCDDFSAITQRLARLGFEVCWWEIPRRRHPEADESACDLPGGLQAPRIQVESVREELHRVGQLMADLAGQPLTRPLLAAGIHQANRVRERLARLRQTVYGAPGAPLPALELLVAEMLAIHFCSDLQETIAVLGDLLAVAEFRVAQRDFLLAEDAVRVFWVNPVADLRALNILETSGGRICGSEYMFTHALDPIPETPDPWEALARTALADPMIGPARDRARRVVAECQAAGVEALVISRIPGASHCAWEGAELRAQAQQTLGIPALEIEVPPLCDPVLSSLRTRLEALIETARSRRKRH